MTSVRKFKSPIEEVKFPEDTQENNSYIITPRSDSHKLEKSTKFSMNITQSSSETDIHGVFTVLHLILLRRSIKSLAAIKDQHGQFLGDIPNFAH